MSSSESLRNLCGLLIRTAGWKSSGRLRTRARRKFKTVARHEQGADADVKTSEAERIVLSERDFGRFLEVIEGPSKPTEALVALVRRRRLSGR
ncbi:type II toxin -antitoxin system TacA 1-like antitoxin [Corallococcus exiguus]|uniref:type II toxin -antitoxin system TacA 1-like antitoxin n=1 Tax=Corallococcus exiguus TaxID=83462 RepID=UPI0034D1ECCB